MSDKNIDSLISLTDYLDSIGLPSSSDRYETILDIWNEAGSPYMKFYSDDIRSKFSLGESLSPDTVHVSNQHKNDLIYEILGEFSHGVQLNKPPSVRDSILTQTINQLNDLGESRYGLDSLTQGGWEEYYPIKTDADSLSWKKYTKKSKDYPIEFEAHRIIEPLLKQRLWDAIKRDKP